MTLSTKDQNTIFSSDTYASFVREFVSKTAKMETKGNFFMVKHGNDLQLLTETGHFMGYVPKDIHPIAYEIVNNKNVAFFMQSSLDYSRFELQRAKLKDRIISICRQNNIETSNAQARELAHSCLINLVKDFLM